MSMTVDEEASLGALRQVSMGRWGEVLRLLEELRDAEPVIRTGSDLLQSELVGLWADRADLGDSREFARRLRQQAESRPGTADPVGP